LLQLDDDLDDDPLLIVIDEQVIHEFDEHLIFEPFIVIQLLLDLEVFEVLVDEIDDLHDPQEDDLSVELQHRIIHDDEVES
jgi:hypothetical protein